MKLDKDTFEIIIFARAGQGAKSAAEVLAQAALREEKYVQAFPFYGPERSGAPTKSYVRISDKPIRAHGPVLDPDLVVVLDDTLLKSQAVSSNLDERESLIVNTRLDEKGIKEKVPKFKGKIHPLDATGIAMEVIGQPRPNSVILGKMIKISHAATLENIKEEFEDTFGAKLSKELVEKNILAIERGHDIL